MLRTIRRDITAPNCLSRITNAPVFYELYHAGSDTQLCVLKTEELDAAFEAKDWQVFVEAEKAWFYTNVVKAAETGTKLMQPLKEEEAEDYCGNVDADITDNSIREAVDSTNYVECKCSICGEIKPSLYRAYPSEEGEANCDKTWICDSCYDELLADD